MNKLSLKKLNEGLQAEFSRLASEDKIKLVLQDNIPGKEYTDSNRLIDWIETNKDIYNNF